MSIINFFDSAINNADKETEPLQGDSKESSLSLSQRAYIIARRQRVMEGMISVLVSFVIMLLFLLILLNPPNLADPIDVGVNVLVLTFFSMFIIYTFPNLRHQSRLLKDWSRDYLQQSYIVVFETTMPTGNTTGEKILNMATAVFPELTGATYTPTFWRGPLRYIVLYSKSKLEKVKKHKTIPKTLNYKINSYLLDLVLETKDGLLIVKDFKDKVVTLNDLKQLERLIDSHFKKEVIFRIIVVAKTFDHSLLNNESLEKQIIKESQTKIFN